MDRIAAKQEDDQMVLQIVFYQMIFTSPHDMRIVPK